MTFCFLRYFYIHVGCVLQKMDNLVTTILRHIHDWNRYLCDDVLTRRLVLLSSYSREMETASLREPRYP